MTVGILQCGDPPEALRADHGSYGEMVQKLLGSSRDTIIYDVTANVLPASVTAHSACLLTGSLAGVYEDTASATRRWHRHSAAASSSRRAAGRRPATL